MDPGIVEKELKDKNVQLTFTNDFVLHGRILSVDSNGVVFKTDQRTSYVAFSRIASIVPED